VRSGAEATPREAQAAEHPDQIGESPGDAGVGELLEVVVVDESGHLGLGSFQAGVRAHEGSGA